MGVLALARGRWVDVWPNEKITGMEHNVVMSIICNKSYGALTSR